MTIYELFQTIKENKSVKQRKNLLKENMNETIRYIFNDTYGGKKCSISSLKKPDTVGSLIIDYDYIEFHNVLNKLRRNEIKNDEKYVALQEVVAKYDEASQEILCNIINRNLKIGLSYDSFLSVIDITDARFNITKFNEIKSLDAVQTDGTYFVADHVPGVRCICKTVKIDDMFYASFYDENNDLITTLDNMVEPIRNFIGFLGCGQFVIDGIIQIDSKSEGEELQQEIENVIYGENIIDNPKYIIYDVLRAVEFEMKEESSNLEWRLDNIRRLIEFANPKNISVIDYTKITSDEILQNGIQHSIDCKCKGCLLRKNTPYNPHTKNAHLIYRHS